MDFGCLRMEDTEEVTEGTDVFISQASFDVSVEGSSGCSVDKAQIEESKGGVGLCKVRDSPCVDDYFEKDKGVHFTVQELAEFVNMLVCNEQQVIDDGDERIEKGDEFIEKGDAFMYIKKGNSDDNVAQEDITERLAHLDSFACAIGATADLSTSKVKSFDVKSVIAEYQANQEYLKSICLVLLDQVRYLQDDVINAFIFQKKSWIETRGPSISSSDSNKFAVHYKRIFEMIFESLFDGDEQRDSHGESNREKVNNLKDIFKALNGELLQEMLKLL
ncbi:hypothetical protein DAMA08_016770 [Martiniozyma asiatica (nom. inval.)]|nr:hypothetical protein DAMA08_016770 [Martiniozyma asiatica]